jgi:ribosomal protein L11 methylase PrmA
VLPNSDIIIKLFDYARKYLEHHHYIIFDIDNSCVKNSQGNFEYNFGKLSKIA